MSSSLEENKKIQIDHYLRCKDLSKDPQRMADDKISYVTLTKFLPVKSGWSVILDLGCGEGKAIEYIRRNTTNLDKSELNHPAYFELDYYGLDCVEEALEIARKKTEFPENFKLGMIEEMPFEDDFFDVVWARHILEHSSDIDKTLNEIIRVLKPEGFLIYALPQGIHDEPAHITETDREGWFKLLSAKFGMLKDGQHSFNLNEYYGVCQNKKGDFYAESE